MNIKRFFLALLITVLALGTVVGGFAAAKFLNLTSLSDEVAEQLDDPITDKFNILVMGLDQDKTRSDTIMIVSVDPSANTIKVLSVPRDTQVLVNGSKIKINATMGYKRREELMIQKLRELTGMPIHYYAEIDFDGFKEVVDILGGVDYDVPYQMDYDDPVQNLHIHLSPGMQHLDGQGAHDYVRFRQGNGGYLPGDYVMGDEGRIKAQQAFFKELVRQKLQPQYLTKAPELIREIYEYVKTNFSLADGMRCIQMLSQLTEDGVQSFVLPGEARYENGVSYYFPDEDAVEELVYTEFGYRDGVEVSPPPLATGSPEASASASARAD